MFLTLNEYLLGASKLLALYGYRCHKQDEDAISFVASYMMKADETWDGKSSSRDTWRFNQAKFAIMKLKTQHKKRRKNVSLNTVLRVMDDGRYLYLQDVIEDKKVCHIHDLTDIMAQAKKCLTPQQFECIKLYYYDGMTLDSIGESMHITKEAVRLRIKGAIKILKHECESKLNYTTS